jgi:trans-2,3-dihydro-3-hydroxyanthranilate isomerase
MRTLPFYQVDVFTDRPFAGNPLAVFPAADGLTAAQMQAIASEMNLSETTFVMEPEGDGDARVRIFTPALELPFAGHPSVGTACELVRLGIVAAVEPVTRVVLELDVGPTLVEVEVSEGVPVAATVHQGPPKFGAPVPRERAAAVLCLEVEDLHDELDPMPVDTGLAYTIIPLKTQRALAHIDLDLALLDAFEHDHAEAYPCAFTGRETPWIAARGLFPLSGIPEDPATGSAAGPLAAYMARAGLLKPGERRVVLQGAAIGRPSLLTVAVTGTAEHIDDVLVGGPVQPVLHGELTLPD